MLVHLTAFCTQEKKIIGFLVGKNQEVFIPTAVHTLSLCADSIIFYDNQSTDNSISVLKNLAQTYPLQVIENTNDMPIDEIYNQLLQEGRKKQGTHFFLLYAHEMLTADYVVSGQLKKTIYNLKQGESLYLPIISVENNYLCYHEQLGGNEIEKTNFLGCAFADVQNAFYENNGDENRVPANINGMQWCWQDEQENGVMICYDYLFKYYVLQACAYKIKNDTEKVYFTNNKIKEIYQSMTKEALQKKHIPFCWFAGYMDFFNAKRFLKADQQMDQTIMQLCQTYGIDFFITIDMWEYAWSFFDFLPLRQDTEMKSQYKQDLFIHSYLFKNKQNGFFVDIGAHDGIKWSNSYFFEKQKGWSGLCIEPIYNAYQELVQNRNAICINACAGKENGQADFFNVHGDPDQLSGLVETYHPLHKKRMEYETSQTHSSFTVEKVPVYTLKSLFEKYNITYVDYLSLDTEGSEMAILEGIDFNQVYIKAMTIENMYFGSLLEDFMKLKGFRKVARLFNCDDVYINMKK